MRLGSGVGTPACVGVDGNRKRAGGIEKNCHSLYLHHREGKEMRIVPSPSKKRGVCVLLATLPFPKREQRRVVPQFMHS